MHAPRVLRRCASVLPLALLALAACDEEGATVLEPFGPPSYDFTVSPTPAGLPSGGVALSVVGGDSSVTLTAFGLRALSGAVYQAWSMDQTETAVPAFGVVVEFSTDDTGAVVIDTVAVSAATYGGSETAYAVQFTISNTDAANTVNHHGRHAVFLSIEGAQATTPGASQFLWRRHGVGGSGALSFGNFGGADVVNAVSARDYVFNPVGTGRAGMRGPEFSVDLVNVARPPAGFYYAGYLIDTLATSVLVDTLRSGFTPVTEESRVSLFDADVNGLLPSVVGNGILRGQVRNCSTGSATTNCANSLPLTGERPFMIQASFALALQPKAGGASMGPGVVLSGSVPEVIREPEEE
jgi:hypothetical protein